MSTYFDNVMNYDIRKAGRRLIEKPDLIALRDTFKGDRRKYNKCVKAVFGDIRDLRKVRGK